MGYYENDYLQVNVYHDHKYMKSFQNVFTLYNKYIYVLNPCVFSISFYTVLWCILQISV